MITISEKKFEGIIRQAFRKGQSWGRCTISIIPTKEQTKKYQDEAIKRVYEIVRDIKN